MWGVRVGTPGVGARDRAHRTEDGCAVLRVVPGSCGALWGGRVLCSLGCSMRALLGRASRQDFVAPDGAAAGMRANDCASVGWQGRPSPDLPYLPQAPHQHK